MKNISKQQLHHVATAFRLGLEGVPWPMDEGQFPYGCCGMASDLLGLFLIEQQLGHAQYVCGEKHPPSSGDQPPGFCTHAWLVLSGYIIDITIDQFEDFNAPVLVRRRSPWHRGWTINPSQCHVVGGWNPDGAYALVYAKARIIANDYLRHSTQTVTTTI